MQITDINQKPATVYEPLTISKSEESTETKASDSVEINQTNATTPMSNWQKDILLDAIEKLENNKQVDNSHPLGQAGNEPIESFQEALIELHYIKSPFFAAEGAKAQANISPEDVVSLFTEN